MTSRIQGIFEDMLLGVSLYAATHEMHRERSGWIPIGETTEETS